MFPGWIQIAIVILLVMLLFGRGKISDLMGDVAKGITSFRKGLREGAEPEPTHAPEAPKSVEDKRTIEGETVQTEVKEKDKA